LFNKPKNKSIMEMNFLAIIAAALSTLVIGFIWYNPKIFGTIWMRESGMTEEKAKGANMAKVFGMAILFGLMIAFFLPPIVIHQVGAMQLVGGDASTALPSYEAFMADYGNHHRSFGHGALHGGMAGLFLALPVIGINSMFERKSWKYILINGGYFIVTMAVMGGIICGWK
jgi:hypothetical protein